MSENEEVSFYDFREVYRAFFAHVIEDSIAAGFVPNAPRQIEEYLAQNQAEFFLPLLSNHAPHEAFSRFQENATNGLPKGHYKRSIYSHLNFSVVRDASKRFIAPAKPGLIGCHYRSIGLDKLRNSSYFGTASYWKKVKQRSADFKEAEPEDHFADLLKAYFELFEKQHTFNQQVFNTNHPPGPIGLIFKRRDEVPPDCQNSSTLIVGSIFEDPGGIDLVNDLQQGLLDGKDRMTILSYLTQESRESRAWDEYRKRLLNRRQLLKQQIERDAARSRAWQDNASLFFRKRLPRNDVADDILAVLTLFESYLVYGLLAGMCVYTFPTTAQPDLPTCGFTLMTEEPLRNEAIEFVQRVSELVYGELIGTTVVSNYRRFFHANLLESGAGQKPLRLLGDEKANVVLASALAGSPIPIEAMNSFLAFAGKLPQTSVYENRRYSFFLVLTHQEFLERFIDRLPGRRLDPGQFKRVKRIPEELFYNDEVSIQLAGHGMRVNAGERSSPGHVLFFVYPPYDLEIFNFEGVRLRSPEMWRQAVERREAVILSDVIPIEDLINSPRLQYTYARYFNSSLDDEIDLDRIAEALTFGNSEVLALLYEYEPWEKMKIYHSGALVLESRLHQWELPARSGDQFISALDKCLHDFTGRQQRFRPLIQEFSRALVRLLVECSRRRKGIFLVFHPEDKPARWGDLDITQQGSGRRYWWEFDADESKEKVAQLCTLLQQSSSSDGAIVLSRKDNGFEVYTKISIQLNWLVDDEILRQALAMKGVQARLEYPALRSFGTKHNAAYEYAMTNGQGGFAVTVSSDGPVTLFYPEKMTEQRASTLGDPEVKDWPWWVNIIRM